MSNLLKIRGKKGMTIEYLAEQAGVTRQAIYSAEKNMSEKTALKLSGILDVSPIELIGEDNLKIKPKTEEEKEYIINIIKGL